MTGQEKLKKTESEIWEVVRVLGREAAKLERSAMRIRMGRHELVEQSGRKNDDGD